MIKKILLNSTLLVIFLGLIAIPMGSMALMKLSEPENPIVLSSKDEREVQTLPDTKELPGEIEDVIRKLEEEYYQTTESTQSTQEEELNIVLP